MLLSEASELYAVKQLRCASESSLRLWAIALRWFDRFLGRAATLDDLNDLTVAKFCQWRRQRVSAATVNRDLGTLLALWRWCHKTGLCSRWPNVEIERVPRRTPIAWTQEEFCRLFQAAKDQDGAIGEIPAGRWWPSLLLVLFDSGERIGAVLRLRWDDVDLRGRWIVFRAETRKGRAEDSAVRIARDTQSWLRRIERTAGLVFPWPYSQTYVWHRYGDLLRSAGLPNDRRRKFHCVRRTTASHLEAAGGNATDALRHSSRRITQVYLDPRICRPPQAVDRLWRPE